MHLRHPSRRAVGAALLGTLIGPAVARARAAAAPALASVPMKWPTKPLRLMVGFPPGSVQDLSARAIAPELSDILDQPVVVENKSGASGIIAGTAVARSNDMHTFGVMNNSQLTIAKILNPNATYNPETDLGPVGLIGTTPLMLVVSKQAPGGPRQDLQWLRDEADRASYGSPGVGTPGHLGMELLKARTGLLMVHIPYQGNPQIINAMIGGQLQAAVLPPGLAMPHVTAGRLKAVGLTSDEHSDLAPGIPTLRELGVLGMDMTLWTALAGPATLPAQVRDRMSAALHQALTAEPVRKRLISAGWQPQPNPARKLSAMIERDTETFGGIIIMRNIKITA